MSEEVLLRNIFSILVILILGSMVTQGFCNTQDKIEIYGSDIVSEGSYFNLYIKNICDENITITFLNYTDTELFLYPNDSITYTIISPEISSLFTNVTYKFKIYGNTSHTTTTYSYTVTVVDRDLPKRFTDVSGKLKLLTILLVITTGICMTIGISLVLEQVWKIIMFLRRRKR